MARVTPPKRYYIQAGLHGNEELPVTFVTWLVKRIETGKSEVSRILQPHEGLDIVPVANPDGYAQMTRMNAFGINLNRNFGINWGVSREPAGAFPMSEPEVRAVAALLKTQNYAFAFDLHGYVPWVVMPSMKAPEGGASNELHRARSDLQALVKRNLSLLPDYEIKTGMELGDGGAFEDYAFWRTGTPALCLEMDSAFRYREEEGTKEDSFLRYEKFIARMIQESRPENLAVDSNVLAKDRLLDGFRTRSTNVMH